MIGLALGVLVMIVVLSVMNGFDREMRTRILGMVPQATVESYQPIDDWRALAEKVKAHEHVTAVAPFTQMQGMLSANGAVQTVMVDAVDPLEEPRSRSFPISSSRARWRNSRPAASASSSANWRRRSSASASATRSP